MGTEQISLPVPHARTWVVGDYLLDSTRSGSRIEIGSIRHGRMKPLTPEIDDDFD